MTFFGSLALLFLVRSHPKHLPHFMKEFITFNRTINKSKEHPITRNIPKFEEDLITSNSSNFMSGNTSGIPDFPVERDDVFISTFLTTSVSIIIFLVSK